MSTKDIIEDYMRSHRSKGVVPSLLLSGIYKLATNPSYDLEAESRIYQEFLASHNVRTRHSFKDYFMDMMTGKDPTAKDLGLIDTGERILDEQGAFISEDIRRRIASEGRLASFLAPRLVSKP